MKLQLGGVLWHVTLVFHSHHHSHFIHLSDGKQPSTYGAHVGWLLSPTPIQMEMSVGGAGGRRRLADLRACHWVRVLKTNLGTFFDFFFPQEKKINFELILGFFLQKIFLFPITTE